MTADHSDAEMRALPSSRQASPRYRNRARDSSEGLLANRAWRPRSSNAPGTLNTGRHLRNRGLARTKSPPPVCFEAKNSLRASAAFRGRFAYCRTDVTFGLKPLERRVDRAYRNIAASALHDLPPNRHAVGVRSQVHQRQQDNVLQSADQVTTRHMFDSVGQIGAVGNATQHAGARPRALAGGPMRSRKRSLNRSGGLEIWSCESGTRRGLGSALRNAGSGARIETLAGAQEKQSTC